jgi:hypothetical protein
VLFAFVFTLVFFLVYYRMFGLITCIALLINLLMVVAVMSLFGATMTLPGFAGLALTVGMSVDANVLINERIREELRAGVPPQTAIATGYDKASGTILDANMTALLAGIALYRLRHRPAEGLRVTMVIGILTSVFTAVTVSRGIATLIYGAARSSSPWPSDGRPTMKPFPLTPDPRTTPTSTSCACAGCRWASPPADGGGDRRDRRQGLQLRAGLHRRHRGGTALRQAAGRGQACASAWPRRLRRRAGADLRHRQRPAGAPAAADGKQDHRRQQGQHRTADVLAAASLPDNPAHLLRSRVRRPAGRQGPGDRTASTRCCSWSSGFLIYIAFRFEWKFAVAAIITTLHDVLIVAGFFA